MPETAQAMIDRGERNGLVGIRREDRLAVEEAANPVLVPRPARSRAPRRERPCYRFSDGAIIGRVEGIDPRCHGAEQAGKFRPQWLSASLCSGATARTNSGIRFSIGASIAQVAGLMIVGMLQGPLPVEVGSAIARKFLAASLCSSKR